MRKLAEDLIAGVDFVAGEGLESLGPKTFDGKRTHYPSVKHGALEDLSI
jgi:hypothetical protein